MLKPNIGKIVVGYDLGNDYSQISYSYIKEPGKVETVSLISGEEQYSIPTVLCKKKEVNQWLFGIEALSYARQNNDECILVNNLLELAEKEIEIELEGVTYQTIKLLALFMKRSLDLLNNIISIDKMAAIMITCKKLNADRMQMLTKVMEVISLKNAKYYFQNHVESFYNYMLYQEKELWKFQVVLFEYKKDVLYFMKMENNKKTTPIVTYISQEQYHMPYYKDEVELKRVATQFQMIVQELLEGQFVSSLYLIGEQFLEPWKEETLKTCCKGIRIFQGNNLYSKGACFSLCELYNETETGKQHIFLGNEKLRANIGMKVYRRGELSYYALLDAGMNWFEASTRGQFYVEKECAVEIIITPLIGMNKKKVKITLEGINMNKYEFTLIQLEVKMLDESKLEITIEDLGFGNFRNATNKKVVEEFVIY